MADGPRLLLMTRFPDLSRLAVDDPMTRSAQFWQLQILAIMAIRLHSLIPSVTVE